MALEATVVKSVDQLVGAHSELEVSQSALTEAPICLRGFLISVAALMCIL